MSPEQDAFIDALYHENFRRLTVYAFHLTEDWGKSEVVVQEAFCVAVEKIGEVMVSDAPLRWMKATVKNVVRNMQKHESYQKALFFSLEELRLPTAAPDALGDMDIWELCGQIAGEENLRLFKHIVLDGASYLEAAKELDIGVWACRKRVQRTTRALREGLENFLLKCPK